MPKTKDPYTCPRCGYETQLKADMRKHLYKLKTSCPGQRSKIVLTDEVRQEVLESRVYQIRSDDNSNSCTINNNFNSYVMDMDPQDKLEKLLVWNNNKPYNFGDKIEQEQSIKIRKLDDRSYEFGFRLEKNQFLDIIDKSIQIHGVSDLNRMNILYIKELNKIAIYHDDEWTNYLFDSGINKIIEIVRNYFLESYEKYILYKIFVDKSVTSQESNIYKNLLNEYFQFLAVFNIWPSCKDIENQYFLEDFSHEKEFFLSDFCIDRYNEQCELLKQCEINKTRKIIGDILKNNNGANLKLLNKYIINLAVNDEKFKNHLLNFTTTTATTSTSTTSN